MLGESGRKEGKEVEGGGGWISVNTLNVEGMGRIN